MLFDPIDDKCRLQNFRQWSHQIKPQNDFCILGPVTWKRIHIENNFLILGIQPKGEIGT